MAKNYFNHLDIHIGDKHTYVIDIEADESVKEAVWDGIAIALATGIEVRLKSQSKPVPDFFGHIYFPIVSEKLKNILTGLKDKDNFEFIACNLPGRKQKYWLLNILNNIECFDWQTSKYETYPSNNKVISDVYELKMHMDKIGDRNLFRMKEKSGYLFISDHLTELFKKDDVTGYRVSASDDLSVG